MELFDVIDIRVGIGSFTIDGISFQWQNPEHGGTKVSSSKTGARSWFAVTHDGRNSSNSLGPVQFSYSKHSMHEGDANCKEKPIPTKDSKLPSDHLQTDLSPDACGDQLRERTKRDSTECLFGDVEYVQLRTSIDPILASCFMCVLRQSDPYREMFVKNICCSFAARRTKIRANGIRLSLDLRSSDLFKMEPDIRWSKKMLPLWLARMSIEDSFSWLSTLGGAYSALGDGFKHFLTVIAQLYCILCQKWKLFHAKEVDADSITCESQFGVDSLFARNVFNGLTAEKAGRVSIHQMKLALEIGDPILQARCRVYMAQSLMQNGFIHQAMFIVRMQYRFALSLGDQTDQRLINMCKGVWSIIQYMHTHRRKKKAGREKEHRKNGVGLQSVSSEAR